MLVRSAAGPAQAAAAQLFSNLSALSQLPWSCALHAIKVGMCGAHCLQPDAVRWWHGSSAYLPLGLFSRLC